MYIDKSSLTYDLFLQLQEMTIQVVDDSSNGWFEASYKSFTNYSLNNSSDLIRLIAFAYSWMPTMAKFKSHFDDTIGTWIVQEINDINKITDSKDFSESENRIKILLFKLTKIVNNSIVGISKMLHFTNPNLFPIIDSRVIRGWNNLMHVVNDGNQRSYIPEYILNIPGKSIPLYIVYVRNIMYWLIEIKKYDDSIQIRDLETYLYLAGAPKH